MKKFGETADGRIVFSESNVISTPVGNSSVLTNPPSPPAAPPCWNVLEQLATCHWSLVTCHLSLETCHFLFVTCHLSLVTCHFSLVICHLSLVTCHLLRVTFQAVEYTPGVSRNPKIYDMTCIKTNCCMWHLSLVTCHMSLVTCHLSHVTCIH